MLKALIILCFVFSNFCAYTQIDSTLSLVSTKTYNTDFITDFTTDNFGSIYIITSTHQLKKFNSNGDSVSAINDIRRFGAITSIDATNPLKVLLYYKDFSKLAVLDRLLNVRNAIDLRKLNIFQVQAYTVSYDNNIWLYDELDGRLKKIDDQGKILLETNDFRQIFDKAPTPTQLYDRDGMLYVYDPLQGLSSIDYYGALKNNLQIKNLKDLQVIDKNTIIGRDSTHIILYKPATLQVFSFQASLPWHQLKKLRFDGQKVYALNNQGVLQIYKVK